MSESFTKLFSSITESTVWVEPYPTRICWVAMLANADQHGRIFASIPGLAKLAGITTPEAEAALICFMSPDSYSRTKDHDGRRIENIDGGWRLLNYGKYRGMRSAEARLEYQREWDRKHRPSGYARQSDKSPTVRPKVRSGPTQAEAEADKEKAKDIVRLTPHDARKDAEKAERLEASKRVLAFLNERAGRNFQPVEETLRPIAARLASGATEAQCRQVIARKLSQWAGDARMEAFLRPKTLFAAENFQNYVGELVIPKD